MDVSHQILLAVGDLKEDIGGLKAAVRNHTERLEEIAKLSGRVSALEHARSRIKGVLLAATAAGGVVGSVGAAIAKAFLQ